MTAGLRKYAPSEDDDADDSDGTHRSTFGWRVATRKTFVSTVGGTTTQQSDTAMDVTTVNLRDFSTNTMLDRGVGVGGQTQTRGTIAATTVDFPAPGELPASDVDVLAVKEKAEQKQLQRQQQQRSIVWLTPDTFQRSASRDDSDDKDADEK